MDRLSFARGRAAVLVALVVLVGACSDDDDPPAEEPAVSIDPTTTRPPSSGGIDVPDLPGTSAAPVPALGFGIAVPDGWQAVVLTDEALRRLEGADLARPSFLDAARKQAATGAVFYAAGVDDRERVAELKVDVQDDAATDRAALEAAAQAVVESGQVEEAEVVTEPGDDGRVRVDYRVTLPAADGDDTIEAYGSQLFVPDGDRLWSFIITSEDEATQNALLDIFGASITFD
jgi:hypothetical protein